MTSAAAVPPDGAGAPGRSVQAAPAVASPDRPAPAAPPGVPTPSAERTAVVVRLAVRRDAAAVAADAGVGAAAGGRERKAGRTRVWEALVAAGRADADRVRPVVDALIAAGHAGDVVWHPVAHAVTLDADPVAVARLRAASGVVAVDPARRHRLAGAAPAGASPRRTTQRPLALLSPAPRAADRLTAVGAPAAWRRGIAGDGVVVAVFDAGVDWTHPSLLGRYRGRDGDHDHDWMDFVEASRRPRDGLGHGTGVAALAVGIDGAGAVGVAPGAEWIAVRAFDDQGSAGDRELLRSGEWLMAPTDLELRVPRPDLAPDVVNASWTLENGVDPLFGPLLKAWRALGMSAVFAAGNDDNDIGPEGTVRMPAAAADALAVGAVDEAGRVWRRSLGGPTWDDRIKPDVVAPGVAVYTASLDDGYDRKDGTSMAAPQVSGAAALARSAQPDLTADDVARLVRQTARDGGAPGADPVFGWGLLAVDRLVDAAVTAGRVAGRVVGPDGPVPHARVTFSAGQATWSADAGPDGGYGLALPEGAWSIVVRAPGWRLASGAPAQVGVVAGATTALDLTVEAAPGVVQTGSVADRWGAPLARARVEAVDDGADAAAVALAEAVDDGAASVPPAADAPRSTVTDAQGRFRLTLPADATQLRVRAAGHRTFTTTLGAALPPTLTLGSAPRILVVDADAWMGDGQRIWPYAVRALADAGYARGDAVDVWTLSGPRAPLPPPAAASPYDIVVWTHLYGSPGSLDRARGDRGATAWLSAWLAAGRRLLVTGQDIGQWDSAEGASSARLAPEFYRDVLGARFLATDAVAASAAGTGIADGLVLRLAWWRGYPKAGRHKPDVVAPAVDGAVPLASYRAGAVAGLAVDGPPARRAYLAFGPESAGDRAALAGLFGVLVAWLAPPRLRLDATPALVRAGGAVRLSIAADGGWPAAPATLRLERPLWLQVADADLPPGWQRADDGSLAWAGPLPPVPMRWALNAVAHPSAAGRLPLTATLAAAGGPVTANAAVEIAAPRLAAASRLAVVPARLVAQGPVRVELRLVNDGTLAATEPFVRIGQLPQGFRPITSTLTASAGEAAWLPEPNDGVRWSGTVPAGKSVTVAFDARVDVPVGVVEPVRATIDQSDADRVELRAGVRVGGPVVAAAGPIRSLPAVFVAGRSAVLTVPLVNRGRALAELTVTVHLPPGIVPDERPAGRWDAAARTLTLTTALPAGAPLALDIPVRIEPDAVAGAREVTVVADDGLAPPAPLVVRFGTDIRRFDLRPSRLVISPDVVASGRPASVTLFVGNFGDAAVDAEAALSLPPALTVNARSVRASGGQVQTDVAAIAWQVRAAPAGDDFTVVPERPTTGWPPPVAGSPLPPADGEGRPAPLALRRPFPFYADVVTRTWVTDDGLVAFAPPPAEPHGALGPAAAGVPAVAALWRPGRRLGTPRAFSDGDATVVQWTAPGRAAPLAAVSFDADGAMRLWLAADAPRDGAIVGLHAPDGRTLTLVAAEIAGVPVRLVGPGGWARLTFDAVPGASLAPNSPLEVRATVSTAGGEPVTVAAHARANRLTFEPSELTLSAGEVPPGGTVGAELNVTTRGDITARGAEARVQLPAGVEVVPGTLSPELRLVDGELVWQGRVDAGTSVALAWQMAVRAPVTDGTRLTVVARLRADGVASTDRRATAVVRRVPAAALVKQPSVGGALVGERVGWRIRGRNVSAVAQRLSLSDVVPPELRYVAGSATASLPPAPVWDASAARLTWQGEVPPGAWVEVRFDSVFAGQPGARVANAVTLDADDGARLTTAAEVVGARGRSYLPWAYAGR